MTDERLGQYLDDFGRELVGAIGPVRRRRFAPRRGGHRVLLLAALSVTGATAALAATGLLSGDPVKSEFGAAVSPHEGKGVPVSSADPLSAFRVADPAGGLPWGMRLVKTTRDAGCLQVGRVLDGQIGYLGIDGAFAEDGLFHPLPAAVLDDASCQPLDGAGRLFSAMSVQGLPASGSARSCLPDPPPTSRPLVSYPRCPPGDLRVLYYGQAGPQAAAVSYTDAAGRRRRTPTSGPDGAYLVVLPVRPGQTPHGSFLSTNSPGTGLRSVRYRDGHVCRIPDPRREGGARFCPLVGYTPLPAIRLTPGQVRSRVHAQVSSTPVLPRGREAVHGGPVVPLWRLTVSFSAPVSTRGVRSYYLVEVRGEHGPTCQAITVAPVTHDVTAGDPVRLTFWIDRRCHGSSGGQASLHRAPTDPALQDQMPYAPRTGADDLTVGAFHFEVPRR